MAQTVKNLPARWKKWAQSLGKEEHLEEGIEPTRVFLPEEYHGQRILVGYSLWGHKESDTTKWLSTPGIAITGVTAWSTVTGLGVQNESGQRQIEFCQENALVIVNTLFQQHKRRFYTRTSPDAKYWNLIISLAAKDGEALYIQQKQDQELTVAQIMNSLLPNSDLNWRN